MALFIAVAASAAVGTAVACEWCGFRGLQKDGRSDSAALPLTWSTSQNVAWRTAIKGRGHSSPIVTDDAVYVTTAYPRADASSSPNVAAHAMLALAVLSAVLGARAAMRSLYARQGNDPIALPRVRFFLFHCVLLGVLVTVLFGRRLLNPGSEQLRQWAVSIVVLLSCLVLISLCASVRSRLQIVAGVLSLVIAAGALLGLPDKGLFLALGSASGIIATAMSLLPVLFGATLFVAHSVGVRKQLREAANGNPDDRNRPVLWRYLLVAAVGYATALVPFGLILYRAAGYQMPDHYIWTDRVAADVGWRWIAAGGAVFVAGSLWCCWRPGGCERNAKLFAAPAFFVAIMLLAIAFGAGFGVSGMEEGFVRAIVCLDRHSGEIRWTCEGLEGRTRARSRTVTEATPTPVTDGDRVYAYFGADGLMAADTEGRLLWKRPEPMFASTFGVATSPVLMDNVLVVVSDVGKSSQMVSAITAFDGATGEPLWKQQRPSHESYAAYGTPLIRSLNGSNAIIVHGWTDVRAYDLETGTELWSYPMSHKAAHLVASPIADEQRLYITGGKSIVALGLSKLGAEGDPVVWSTPVPGEKSSTPVVVDGLLFLVTEVGRAFCLDAETGRTQWSERLKGRFYASVTAVRDRVLFTNEAGKTTVVAVGREFRQLAVNDLDGSVYASPALTGNQMFVRTTEYLYCLEETVEGNEGSR